MLVAAALEGRDRVVCAEFVTADVCSDESDAAAAWAAKCACRPVSILERRALWSLRRCIMRARVVRTALVNLF